MNQLRAAARPCARVWFTRQNLCLWAPWEFSRGIPAPRIFQGYSCFSYLEQHLRNLAASGFCQMPKKIRRSPQNEATRLQAQFQTIPSIWQCQCFPASLEILFLLPHGYWVFFTCGRNAERSQMCWGRKCEHWFHSAQKLNWCGWSFQKQVWFSAVFEIFPLVSETLESSDFPSWAAGRRAKVAQRENPTSFLCFHGSHHVVLSSRTSHTMRRD